jgi:nucleoid DNA-binding protein
VINFIWETAVASLLLDGRFVYPGFGIFTTKKREAYTGRNPKTGDPAKVQAKTSVKFKMTKDLKEAVNG